MFHTQWKCANAFPCKTAKRWGRAAIGLGVFTFIVELIFALSLQQLAVSSGLVSGDPSGGIFLDGKQSVTVAAVIFISVAFLRLCLTWLNGVAVGIMQTTFEAEMRKNISRWSLLSAGVSTGTVATLFNDVVVGSGAAFSSIYFFVGRIVMITFTFCVLAYHSPTITVISLCAVVLCIPAQRFLDVRISQASEQIRQSVASVTEGLMRSVKNSYFIRIHGLAETEGKEQDWLIAQFEQSSKKYHIFGSARGVVPQLIGVIVITLVMVGVANQSEISAGFTIAYIYLVMRFFQAISDASRVTANINGNWPRMRELRDWYESESLQSGAEENIITRPERYSIREPVGFRLSNVSFKWGIEPIISGISVKINAGEMVILTGPSGCGKTTLLMIMCNILKATSGSIDIIHNGSEYNIDELGDSLTEGMAYVGPDPFIIEGTVRAYLNYGSATSYNQEEIFTTLKKCNCGFIFALDKGLDHYITEQGGGLSAGQMQRLSLTRAMLKQPKLLLLDEATSNLDNVSEQKIVDALKSLKGTMTILFATHRTAISKIADTTIDLGLSSENMTKNDA